MEKWAPHKCVLGRPVTGHNWTLWINTEPDSFQFTLFHLHNRHKSKISNLVYSTVIKTDRIILNMMENNNVV